MPFFTLILLNVKLKTLKNIICYLADFSLNSKLTVDLYVGGGAG